jgi:H+/Cl- antiporter ClcA
MFVPMLLIGAVLGRVVGLMMVDLFPVDSTDNWWLPAEDAQWKWIDPGVFAVVGAAAFMGGVTRLTVALAAIMMEARPSHFGICADIYTAVQHCLTHTASLH